MKEYAAQNAKMFDSWVEDGWEYGSPLTEEQCEEVRKGNFNLYLASLVPVPRDWLPEPIAGKKVLGLAAGGGQQMAVLSLLGADCTLIDVSSAQIKADEMVAKREGYAIKTVQADISEPLPFEDDEFDLIVAPVSFCYIQEIEPVLNECARVLKNGATMLIGFDNVVNFISSDQFHIDTKLPFDPLTNPEQYNEEDGYQFSHTVGEQLKALLQAHFQIADVFEDYNILGHLKKLHIPSFLAVKAVLRK